MGSSDGCHDYSLHVDRLALGDALQTDRNICDKMCGCVPGGGALMRGRVRDRLTRC